MTSKPINIELAKKLRAIVDIVVQAETNKIVLADFQRDAEASREEVHRLRKIVKRQRAVIAELEAQLGIDDAF